MSYRVRDITSIHNSALNNSISKQQYTIPRAERFRNNKTESSYKYYELPSTNDHKASTFGHSQRKTIATGDQNLPSPDKYFLNSLHALHLDSRQISFAKGRQECKNVNFLKGSEAPGPGTYNPNPEFVDPFVGSKYSMRVRTQKSEKVFNTIAPGPGKYQVKVPWLEREKVLSTDKRYGCPLIRPSKSRREIGNDEMSSVPFYNPKKTMKGEDTFNNTGYSIGKGMRFQKRLKTEVPGPGSYNRFSQFI